MMSHRLGVTVWLMEAARLISTRPLFLISEVDWIVLVVGTVLQSEGMKGASSLTALECLKVVGMVLPSEGMKGASSLVALECLKVVGTVLP
ncbi:hypothetical protein GOBAR_AA00822 [Gossypium barbadense]|uniref:Uncharacterized protein n=1 Tax=Gossypium barbadense TaxID=3634 RepID=A0A2P5YW10_GOSBA|nr:hypothetical protein GOBAR_AA00822 [Gossypium barbadense]